MCMFYVLIKFYDMFDRLVYGSIDWWNISLECIIIFGVM